MLVTLLHNPKAGSQRIRLHDLLRDFERAGHQVTPYSTSEEDLSRALRQPGDLVVVAGGDGTVKKVASKLFGGQTPLAILPVGTANNIAGALEVSGGLGALIRSFEHSEIISMDVGMAKWPNGESLVLEGAGIGLLPYMIYKHVTNEELGVRDAVGIFGGVLGGLHLLRQALSTFNGPECSVELEDKELTGKYLMVEILNIPAIGPGLELAPGALPDDGYLDVVMVGDGEREKLGRHVESHVMNEPGVVFQSHRTRHVRLRCSPTMFHIDDESQPTHPELLSSDSNREVPRDFELEVKVVPRALRVLVPAEYKRKRGHQPSVPLLSNP